MQDLSNITTLDLVIVALYLLGMLGIGVYFVRRIQNAGDYYVAGRSLGPLVLAGTVCATIIGGSAMMGRAGLGYDYGSLAVVTALPYLIGMFVFSGISGRIQEVGVKYNITSIPELFEKRFSKTAKCLIALLIGYTMMGTVASQITAVAVIVKMIGGKIGITYEMGACLATFIFKFNTAESGLLGVVYTDVVQFFMLIIFVYILLPLSGIRYLGGFGNFWSNVPKEMLIPNIDGKVVGDIVTYLVFTMAGAEMWQRAFAAKSRKAAKEGMFWGTSIYGCTIFIILMLGLMGRQILPNVKELYGTAEAVIPGLVIHILPVGITGLCLAGLLSVMMSSADSYLLISTQTFVQDLGKTLNPKMSDKREVFISRILSAVLAIGALIIALYIKNAYNALMFAWTFYAASVGLPALAALYWRKATNAGIIASIVSGFVVSIGWDLIGKPWGLGSAVPGSLVCAVVLVTVSLATYKTHPSEMV